MADPLRPSAMVDDGGLGGLQVLVTAGPTRFVADVTVEAGGLDLGPNPHDLVAAGLGACTAMTLRLYAKRKAWPLGAVRVTVTTRREPGATPADVFDRVITLTGELDDAQRVRLMEIAEMCPVHRMLAAGVRIETRLG
jgi:putative redox protein